MSFSPSQNAGHALHALLLAVAAAVFANELTLPPGVVAAAAGAFAGSLWAESLHARRLRTFASVALGLLVGGLGLALTQVFLGSATLAEALGPTVAMGVGEVVRWVAVALGGALVLRAVALGYRAALALEGSIAVLVVATTVQAHRDGMIARPLEISDWFWQQGIDPVVAFLGVGLLAGLLLAGVMARGRSPGRTLAQLLIVLLLGLWLGVRLHREPPESDLRNAVGEKLDKAQDGDRDGPASAGQGGQGESKEGKNKQDNDLPPPPKQHGGQQRPSAVVVFHRDVLPFGEVFYFRHAAFSQFNGARLVEATRRGVDPDARYDARPEGFDVPGVHNSGLDREEVATDVALMSEHSRTFALIDATRVEPRPNPDSARFRRAYRVVSQVVSADVPLENLLGLAPGDPGWDEATWSLYTELPHDERYHDLARRLQSELRPEYKSDPIALAFAVKQYLEENTTYSFKRKYTGDDPTGEFLFSEDKRGYCVHLAHAAAYLMRALGLPARVSAGYAVPAANLGTGSALLIKEGDAHAWAELYLEGLGWLPIEVTPQKTDVEPAPFEEQDLQQLLGEMARKEGRFERAPPTGPKLMDYLRAAWDAVPWVLLGFLGVLYAVKVGRLLLPLVLRGGGGPKVSYRAALDTLASVGWVRGRGESRERFAGRVAERVPAFEALTRVNVGAALGARAPLEAAQGVSLAALYRMTAGQVRGAVPWYRWLLGVLNPLSWWWSR
ncbi:MAG: transglutaminase domain-containing protein [Myxococcales bacterium]|nr:transglutaminase domain-containing protein [Myxococcales bacterium]